LYDGAEPVLRRRHRVSLKTKRGLAIALLVLAAAADAVAQPTSSPVSLTWNSPVDCPSREQVLAEVARVLGGAHEARIPAIARADVARTNTGRWQAALRVEARDVHSERNLEAESCEAIASGVALIVAVAVEGSVPPLAPPASTPKVPDAAPAESGASSHASQLLVAAAGVIDDGTMPPIAGGGEAALGWSYATPSWRARALAGASYFPSASKNIATREGGTFTLFAPFARLCWSIARGPFDIGPCLGGEIDRMSGQGFGPPPIQPLDNNATWGSAVGTALASWSLSGPIAVFARADGIVPLAQPTFRLLPDTNVHQPALPAWRAAFGVELRFF
jgi:hypothetical protein